MNDYFINQINDLVGEINDECETSTPFGASHSDNRNSIDLNVEYCPSMKFVLKTTSSLSCKKATGHNDLSVKLIKLLVKVPIDLTTLVRIMEFINQ